MNDNTVAIAALGVLGTCVGLMAWVVKKVLGDVAPALQKHSESAEGLKEAVQKNTDSNDQMLTFMKKLNGKLPKLVDEKMKQASKE